MKKLFLLGIVAFAGVIITSCNSDDDSPKSATLEGKWYYSEDGFKVNGQESLMDYDDHEVGCEKDYIEFLNNGNYRDVDYINTDCDTSIDNGMWSRNNNSLTIGTGADAINATIINLSENVLKVSVSDTENGTTIEYITLFTKQ